MGELFQPTHLLILFFFFLLPLCLIPTIFYILTLQKALAKCIPPTRTMEPGMVWLLLVPFFNIIWNFFVVMAIGKSVGAEFAKRGIPSPEPEPGQPIGLAMSICACCCIIPLLGFFAGLAYLVLWILYWVKVAEYSRMLDYAPIAAVPMPPTVS